MADFWEESALDRIAGGPRAGAENGGVSTEPTPVDAVPEPVVVPPPAPRESRRRRWLHALLGAAIALCLAGLAYWRIVPLAPPAPEPLPPPADYRGPTTIESALPILQAQADRWLPGAAPMLVTMQIDWPWDVPPGATRAIPETGWISAVYAAPWDAPFGRRERAATLGMVLDRLSGRIAGQTVTGWETPPGRRMSTAPTGQDSTSAMLAAERAGGTAFRAACPAQRHLSRITLAGPDGRWPRHWVVTYQDSRKPELHGLLLRIEAETGELLDSEDDAPPCPGTEPAG